MRKTSEMMDATHKRNAKREIDPVDLCQHEFVDDGMFMLVCMKCGLEEVSDPEEEKVDE